MKKMVSTHIITRKNLRTKKNKKLFQHIKSVFIKLKKINFLQKTFQHIL
jgi:hypothetical protein